MSKVRAYDLAKELGLESKLVIELARQLGTDISVPSNTLEDPIANKIRESCISSKPLPKINSDDGNRKKTRTLSKKRKRVLIALERVIGECHNPHSTKVTAIDWGRYYDYEFGKTFNYKTWHMDQNGKEIKDPYLGDDPDPNFLMSGYYKFGANHLSIYQNLDKALRYLEEKHGLVIDDDRE